MTNCLETDRLLLRHFMPGDETDCFAFLSDRKTCHWDGGYEPFTEMDQEYMALMEKFRSQDNRYMIVLKAENKVIGTVNLFEDERRAVDAMEVGYVVSPTFRRRGYASEALERVIAHLFQDTDTTMITAGAISQNLPSLAMLRKLGFTQEGRIHKGFFLPGEGAVDMISFYLEKPETAFG